MFNNSYLIALVIPLLLMICGALAKKLVRGGGWKDADFFLGVELALAALGSAMVYFYDLQKMGENAENTHVLGEKISATATFLIINFCLLLWVMSTHQDWELRTQNRKGQIFMLGVLSNFVGVALFAAFVVIVKGV